MVFKDLETCLGVGKEGRGRGSELSEMIARREKKGEMHTEAGKKRGRVEKYVLAACECQF